MSSWANAEAKVERLPTCFNGYLEPEIDLEFLESLNMQDPNFNRATKTGS